VNSGSANPAGRVPRRVLLVEDNFIIALDTEEHLLSLGVHAVNLASSSGAALASLKANTPDFALLDFNLGEETSEPVACALEAGGVRFAFATGYGEVDDMVEKYPHSVGVLQKPYSREDLARILAQPVPA
jgi:CheY-like chemotaxis protein